MGRLVGRLNKFKKRSKVSLKSIIEKSNFSEEEQLLSIDLWTALDELEFTPEEIKALAISVTLIALKGNSFEDICYFLAGFKGGLSKEVTLN